MLRPEQLSGDLVDRRFPPDFPGRVLPELHRQVLLVPDGGDIERPAFRPQLVDPHLQGGIGHLHSQRRVGDRITEVRRIIEDDQVGPAPSPGQQDAEGTPSEAA